MGHFHTLGSHKGIMILIYFRRGKVMGTTRFNYARSNVA